MTEFVFEYRFLFVLLLYTLTFALFEWERFKGKVVAVMLGAKQLSKEKVLITGKEQEDYVVMKILSYLPKWVGMNIPEEILRRIIKHLYIRAMDYIDDGHLNNSF